MGALLCGVTQPDLGCLYQHQFAAVQTQISEVSQVGICSSSMKKAYSLVNTAKAKDQEAVQSVYLKVSVIFGAQGEKRLCFNCLFLLKE